VAHWAACFFSPDLKMGGEKKKGPALQESLRNRPTLVFLPANRWPPSRCDARSPERAIFVTQSIHADTHEIPADSCTLFYFYLWLLSFHFQLH
jgi:hypothetical protein